VGEEGATPTQELLDALFEVGETILRIDWDGGPFQPSPYETFTDLVKEVLKSWILSGGEHHLESAFKKSNSPFVSAHVFLIQAEQLRLMASSSDEAPFASLDALGKYYCRSLSGRRPTERLRTRRDMQPSSGPGNASVTQ